MKTLNFLQEVNMKYLLKAQSITKRVIFFFFMISVFKI